MANSDKSSRRDLTCKSYSENVITRLRKANEKAIKDKENYRYVPLGQEIFPIHIDMVSTYNNSDRSFKRGMKKQYKKMLKKHNKNK